MTDIETAVAETPTETTHEAATDPSPATADTVVTEVPSAEAPAETAVEHAAEPTAEAVAAPASDLSWLEIVKASVTKLQHVVDNPANYRMIGDGDGQSPTNLWHDVLRDELALIAKHLPA